MDTTLSANGKLIWWAGTAWIDPTGTSILETGNFFRFYLYAGSEEDGL
jgi:hypothetical protein